MVDTDKFQYDPEKGYNRYSYRHRPPDLPGFKIIHVVAHMRGNVPIAEHWFYSRIGPTGRLLRGTLARKHMKQMGIVQTSAPPQLLVETPDSIGTVQGLMPKEYHQGRTINRKTPRKRPGPKPGTKYGPRTKYTPVRFPAVATRMAGSAGKSSDPIWVPVVGAGDAVHGWIDLSGVRYVTCDDLTPEGIGGKVTSAAELRFTENFTEALDSLKK